MISAKLLAVWKDLAHDDRVPQCDAIVRQTPHVFSDSPGRYNLNLIKGCKPNHATFSRPALQNQKTFHIFRSLSEMIRKI